MLMKVLPNKTGMSVVHNARSLLLERRFMPGMESSFSGSPVLLV